MICDSVLPRYIGDSTRSRMIAIESNAMPVYVLNFRQFNEFGPPITSNVALRALPLKPYTSAHMLGYRLVGRR